MHQNGVNSEVSTIEAYDVRWVPILIQAEESLDSKYRGVVSYEVSCSRALGHRNIPYTTWRTVDQYHARSYLVSKFPIKPKLSYNPIYHRLE